MLGWTPGQGGRGNSFGALLLGAHVDGELRWVGQVGTGFTDQMIASLMTRLGDLVTDAPPIDDPELTTVKGARWVRPELVVDVEYLQMTRVGKMRAPSFKGIRIDKLPEDTVMEPQAVGTTAEDDEEEKAPKPARPRRRRPRPRQEGSGPEAGGEEGYAGGSNPARVSMTRTSRSSRPRSTSSTYRRATASVRPQRGQNE